MNGTSAIANNRILIIDDNPAIHEDFRKILCRHDTRKDALADAKAQLFGDDAPNAFGACFEIESAFQGEEGLRKVQQALAEGRPYTLAFVDIRMPPGWDGVETVSRLWAADSRLQCVICTAHSDYSWDQMIHRSGMSDNLVILKKPFDNIEVLQLAHALTRKWHLQNQLQMRLNDLGKRVDDRTAELIVANEQLKREIRDRTSAEEARRSSEERFAKAFRSSPVAVAILRVNEGIHVDANPAYEALTGYALDELLGCAPGKLGLWAEPAEAERIIGKFRDGAVVREEPCRILAKGGQVRDTLLSLELLELNHEPCALLTIHDITEQLRLEAKLRQAQKMEAIGQLAAGIAHDFNNILTVIQGHTSLLLAEKPSDSGDREALQTVADAASRASRLIRQLLAFSHRQVMQIQAMDIHDTLAAISLMLPQMLGEHIDVKMEVAPNVPLIDADSAMMEQILMNLVANSRDAMPEGGRLSISARGVTVGQDVMSNNPEARPGRFLRLSVADTGCGMPPELLPRIFDPFFTTKPVGKGTGLGLATVYGIAKQHSGWIDVESEVGKGATFHIFIPRSEHVPVATGTRSPFEKALPGGHETVLVVEDEASVCDFVVKVLRAHGYTVHAVHSGVEALAFRKGFSGKIDLLLTDLVMPGGVMGRELAQRLRVNDAALRIIYSSGYSPGMAGKDLDLTEGINFLPKPYDPMRLLRIIRDCLDGKLG